MLIHSTRNSDSSCLTGKMADDSHSARDAAEMKKAVSE